MSNKKKLELIKGKVQETTPENRVKYLFVNIPDPKAPEYLIANLNIYNAKEFCKWILEKAAELDRATGNNLRLSIKHSDRGYYYAQIDTHHYKLVNNKK